MPKARNTGRYVRVSEQIDAGDERALIDPLDYLIIDHLHEEGETFAGLYPLSHTAAQINREVFENKIDTKFLAPRFTTLQRGGLVVRVKVPGVRGANSYQRTAAGKKLVREWKAKKEHQEKEQTDGS